MFMCFCSTPSMFYCTLRRKNLHVFIGLLLDIWRCINILRSMLYARTLHKARLVWLSMHIHPCFDYMSEQITLHLAMISGFRFYLQHATWTSLILLYMLSSSKLHVALHVRVKCEQISTYHIIIGKHVHLESHTNKFKMYA